MKRVGQMLLVPFWIIGFCAAVIVIIVLAVVAATRSGYRDVTTWSMP